ncbi:amidase [Halobacillus sp. ACCC02827]|uniref:amidase n=1 Tax=Halobacillus sp. ACCC02827 TaxID=3052090 RepID=UPI002570EDD7|nr:amidase [Halobacillus sp. ACCC02827]WJE14884.1 amidase [Halobacillus sp. ACCC02827]
MTDAFIKEDMRKEPTGSGILDGLTFGVKDVISVAGHTNAAGNPDWLNTHAPAQHNAPVIDRLLEEGALLHGMTHTDELMYSLNGENVHYGTPINPKSPACIPGGSSSGSAAAASGGEVHFALGTDTGGSVRIPSSYCGIYGFRPTHGAIDVQGVIPLAPSFDTIGWMADDPVILSRVGDIFFRRGKGSPRLEKIKIASDLWGLLDPDLHKCYAAPLRQVKVMFKEVETRLLSEDGLGEWADTFRVLQAQEIWQEHGGWIADVRPRFAYDIYRRLLWARSISDQDMTERKAYRNKIKAWTNAWIGDDGVLLLPTTPAGPPKRGTPASRLEDIRTKTMKLSCIAGLAGLPQVTIPLPSTVEGPVSISLIAAKGQDLKLLETACLISKELRKGDAYETDSVQGTPEELLWNRA